mmetsp:Transcript_22254/g.41496  ORF Transcript_22254/g.41496 Transcript_22254/m.41496 type:complete len:99 (-) Transcript_22254:72-368(-)
MRAVNRSQDHRNGTGTRKSRQDNPIAGCGLWPQGSDDFIENRSTFSTQIKALEKERDATDPSSGVSESDNDDKEEYEEDGVREAMELVSRRANRWRRR